MQTNTLYRWVTISSEEDLPKGKGTYHAICEIKGYIDKYFEDTEYWRRDWITFIKGYFLPVPIPTQTAEELAKEIRDEALACATNNIQKGKSALYVGIDSYLSGYNLGFQNGHKSSQQPTEGGE